MPRKFIKQQTRAPGAPKKAESAKITNRGLRQDQEEWIESEANLLGVPFAKVLRDSVDWYKTAKETKRGDVSASEMFDDKYKRGEQ